MERDRSSLTLPEFRDEFQEIASPPCHECGEPIRYVEQMWGWIYDLNDYRVCKMVMVCANKHRVVVEELPV